MPGEQGGLPATPSRSGAAFQTAPRDAGNARYIFSPWTLKWCRVRSKQSRGTPPFQGGKRHGVSGKGEKPNIPGGITPTYRSAIVTREIFIRFWTFRNFWESDWLKEDGIKDT